MLRKRLIPFGLASVAIIALGATAFAAITSTSYRLANNTFEGGDSGSGVSSTSTSYSLEGITFGSTTSALSSSTYRLCTGFACSDPIFGLSLTSLQK
jgi:hypothetical protein